MPLIETHAELYEEVVGHDDAHPADARNQLTIGDLHGNALKLIYFLLRQNVLRLPAPDDYKHLVGIYRKKKLTTEDLARFEAILARMEVNLVGTVRLIGDELADRGQNDYLTLKVIDFLRRKGVSVEILLSNHSVKFIEAYEKNTAFISGRLFDGQARSMYSLNQLIQDQLVTREAVLSIVDNSYKPFLRALSYTLNQDKTKITIFSHAGIDLSTIEKLAGTLGVEYCDDTVEALAGTIDRINVEFYKHVKNNSVHTLYSTAKMYNGGRDFDLDDNAFAFLMWNRHYHALNRPADYKGYHIDFVHGHDNSELTHQNIFNLDNTLGKMVLSGSGQYSIHFSQDNPAPVLEPFVAAEAVESVAVGEPTESTSINDKNNHLSVDANNSNQENVNNFVYEIKGKGELFYKIDKMKEYGERLITKDYAKGKTAIELSKALRLLATGYFQNAESNTTFEEFKTKFLEALHSKDAIMNKHRALWRPIVLNIAIALTGVGLLVLAGKLAQSKITTGKCSFFCTTTKRGRQVNKIEKIIDKLNPSK